MVVQYYQQQALRESTHGTYHGHIQSYLRYLHAAGEPVYVPSDPSAARASVLRWLAGERHERGSRWNTLHGKKAAVRSFYLYQGYPDVTDAFEVKAFLKGVKQIDGGGTPAQKRPFTMRHMEALYSLIDVRLPDGSATWAAACLGFFFLLRVSNIAASARGSYDARYVLLRRNVRFFEGGREISAEQAAAGQADAVEIKVQRSKNDLKPLIRRVYRSGHPYICPVMALASHLRVTRGAPEEWPVVASGREARADGRPQALLGRDQLARQLKRAASVLGEDPSNTGTHSLRIGGATELHNQGVPDSWIKDWGNWSSLAFLEYCRDLGEYPRHLARIMTASLKLESLASAFPWLSYTVGGKAA